MLKTIERKKAVPKEKIDVEVDHMDRLPRGSFKAKPGAIDPQNCKVKITTYIDADVLEFFKQRAKQPNAAPYQTQINTELRKVMENGSIDAKSELLNNKRFLRALKQKLEEV
jgi:uncharacterized protein (DUF4415 family)